MRTVHPVYKPCAFIPNLSPTKDIKCILSVIHIIDGNTGSGTDSRGTPLSQNLNLWDPLECICKWTLRIISIHLQQDRPIKTLKILSALFRLVEAICLFQSYGIWQRLFVWEPKAVSGMIWLWHCMISERVNISPQTTNLSYADAHCSPWLFKNRLWSHMNLVYLASHPFYHGSLPGQVSSSGTSPAWVHYAIAGAHSTAAHKHTQTTETL